VIAFLLIPFVFAFSFFLLPKWAPLGSGKNESKPGALYKLREN
jgi:hypothetical protein